MTTLKNIVRAKARHVEGLDEVAQCKNKEKKGGKNTNVATLQACWQWLYTRRGSEGVKKRRGRGLGKSI